MRFLIWRLDLQKKVLFKISAKVKISSLSVKTFQTKLHNIIIIIIITSSFSGKSLLVDPHTDCHSSIGMATGDWLGCSGIECRSRWPRVLGRRSVAACLLESRVRIPPGAWMFMLCVVSKDKKAKWRTMKTKTQVRLQCRVEENTIKNPGKGDIFRSRPDPLWGPPSLLYSGHHVCFSGGKAAGAWR